VTLVLDAKDEAPAILTQHFVNVLSEMKDLTWKPMIPEKTDALSKFDLKSLQNHRELPLQPEPVWLGPNLLKRSVTSLFDSIRRLYAQYNTVRVATLITAHFSVGLSLYVSHLRNLLQQAYPSLAPKPRGRKRKRSNATVHISESKEDTYVIEDIKLEGATLRRPKVVAVFCKWKGLPDSTSSWQPLDDQPRDLIEWWSEESELRYPLIPSQEIQVPLKRLRNGAFERL
jgi:hypothetical protein